MRSLNELPDAVFHDKVGHEPQKLSNLSKVILIERRESVNGGATFETKNPRLLWVTLD